MREEVESSLKKQSCNEWILSSEDGGVVTKAAVSLYAGNAYLNIRVFYEDRATKQGVTMGKAEWNSINLLLDHGPEMTMARLVYKDMYEDRVNDLKKQLCEGCVKESGTQTDHYCVMKPAKLLAEVLAGDPCVDVFDFVERAASVGGQAGIALSRPVDMFNMCDKFYKNQLSNMMVDGATQEDGGGGKVDPQSRFKTWKKARK